MLQFAACWPRRAIARLADVDVACWSREDLITNKRSIGRPEDLDAARERERRREPDDVR
ncbi:MAG: hypothetical protein IPK26_26745 [Planctomycetes bacterium]|nr:hypothetical protein [Planctomycetota bacterium]